MARLQCLNLPENRFVLVLDQFVTPEYEGERETQAATFLGLKEEIGAVSILVSTDRLDIENN